MGGVFADQYPLLWSPYLSSGLPESLAEPLISSRFGSDPERV